MELVLELFTTVTAGLLCQLGTTSWSRQDDYGA
jgi:hypothetical protein